MHVLTQTAPGPSPVTSRPFSCGTETPKTQAEARKVIKGMAELSRLVPDWEGMRSVARVQKAAFQQRFLVRDRKQGNRHRRSRAA